MRLGILTGFISLTISIPEQYVEDAHFSPFDSSMRKSSGMFLQQQQRTSFWRKQSVLLQEESCFHEQLLAMLAMGSILIHVGWKMAMYLDNLVNNAGQLWLDSAALLATAERITVHHSSWADNSGDSRVYNVKVQ